MSGGRALPLPAAGAGVITRHWRGALPLGGSYWWRFALPLSAFSLLADALAGWIALQGSHLQAASLLLLASWLALLAATVWGGVGAWRAAAVQAQAQGAARAAAAARTGVVLGVAAVALSLALGAWPQIGGWLVLACGSDPLGAVQARPSPDSRRLRLQGPLAEGAAARVAQVLAAAPGIHLLELDTPGGRHAEGLAIAALVQSRRLQTRIVGACDNACVAIFAVGSARQVMPGGRLGLHRWPSGSVNPLFELFARRWQAGELRRLGLPETAVVKALASSPVRPWVLETDELLAAGLIGVPDRPLDVALPPPGPVLPAEYGEALLSSPAWRGFEAYRAGTLAAAAQAMAAARARGRSDDETQVAAQRSVEAMLPDLVRDAGPALREQYLALLQGQLEAAQAGGAADCRAVLAGDAAARRGLPAPWPAQEAAWLLAAAAEPAPAPPRPLSALEAEVVHRALGERAAPLLGAVRRMPRTGARPEECRRAAGLIAEVLGLPAPERRLAIRLMFDRG